jgi:peptidyl-tRNA hydrolase, PTH2 family
LQKNHAFILNDWENCHSKKVVVKANSLQEIIGLQEKAEILGIPFSIITDAGKTQIEKNTKTVFALCDKESKVNQVTGHLKLY